MMQITRGIWASAPSLPDMGSDQIGEPWTMGFTPSSALFQISPITVKATTLLLTSLQFPVIITGLM